MNDSLCENCEVGKLVEIGIDDRVIVCDNSECTCVIIDKAERTFYNKRPHVITKKRKFTESTNISLAEINLSSSDESGEDSIEKSYNVENLRKEMTALIQKSHNKNVFFNWFMLPLMIKFHKKISIFILMHFNLFQLERCLSIFKLKELYDKASSYAAKIPRQFGILLAYKFANLLYNESSKFSIPLTNNLDMTERIICSVNKILNLYLDGDDKSTYSYSEKCNECSHTFEFVKYDFFVRFRSAQNITYNDGNFNQFIECRECLGDCTATTKLDGISNFVFLVFPNGLKNDESVKILQTIHLSNRHNQRLKLQAIFELQIENPIIDVQEREPEITEFASRSILRQKHSYSIHFRNSDGWFSFNKSSPHLLKRIYMDSLSVTSANVRLVLFALPVEIAPTDDSLANPSTMTTELQWCKSLALSDSSQFPVSRLRHFIFMLKCRDFCLSQENLTTDLVARVSKEMVKILTEHSQKKQRRRKQNHQLSVKAETKNKSDSFDEVKTKTMKVDISTNVKEKNEISKDKVVRKRRKLEVMDQEIQVGSDEKTIDALIAIKHRKLRNRRI